MKANHRKGKNMAGTIEYVFEQQDVIVEAEFIDEAVEGSQILWEHLATPITSEVVHGKWAGPEVWIKIPPPPRPVPNEFMIATPIPGDILYLSIPETPVRRMGAMHEFAMFYGREGRSLMLQAGLLYGYRGCLVATIKDKQNLKKFAEACENVHRFNYQRITVRRGGN